MALVWFVDKFPRSRKPVQYRRLEDIVSFHATIDRLKRQNEFNQYPNTNTKVILSTLLNINGLNNNFTFNDIYVSHTKT